MTEKIAIIMRSLPGGGKSFTVNQLLKKYQVDYNHVFSTDNQWTPVSTKLKKQQDINPRNTSLNDAIVFCNELMQMWFDSKYSEAKETGQQEFLNFKKIVDEGKYYQAIEYAQSIHHVLDKTEYLSNFNVAKLGYVHKLNHEEFRKALEQGMTPVIVDNTNVSIKDVQGYVDDAKEFGYEVKIQEPESPHWLANRDLFKDKYENRHQLKDFADLLASKNAHGVSSEIIQNMMNKWVHNMKPSDFDKEEKE